MGQQQRHQRSAVSGQPDPAWEMVRRWPGMRGEDKLAWLYVWRRSRGGLEQIDITPAEIANDQNVSSDAGRQRIKNLDAAGLILIVRSDRSTGVRTIEMPLPSDVSRARKIEWDGQFEFGFMDAGFMDAGAHDASDDGESQATSRAATAACAPACDDDMEVRRLGIADTPVEFAEPPFDNRTEVPRFTPEEAPPAPRSRTEEPPLAPEEPPEVPRFDPENDRASRARVSPSKPSEEGFSTPSNTFGNTSLSPSTLGGAGGADRRRGRRGTSGGFAPAEDALVEELVARIDRKVRDPKLRMSPKLKVARAVIALRISRADLESLLESVDRGQRHPRTYRCPPSAYAIGGFKKLFERAGLEWDQ